MRHEFLDYSTSYPKPWCVLYPKAWWVFYSESKKKKEKKRKVELSTYMVMLGIHKLSLKEVNINRIYQLIFRRDREANCWEDWIKFSLKKFWSSRNRARLQWSPARAKRENNGEKKIKGVDIWRLHYKQVINLFQTVINLLCQLFFFFLKENNNSLKK